jgi:hypothetical protein
VKYLYGHWSTSVYKKNRTFYKKNKKKSNINLQNSKPKTKN